jgi:penicillin amidase
LIRRIAAAVILAALLLVGFRGAGPLPALGPLLDPANGVWASAAATNFPARQLAQIPGLEDSVTVVFDDRAVPHIFAKRENDAWRALGFVVARDRLFQMEAQTRAASGRLSEWAGKRALPPDRYTRGLGLAWGAQRKFAAYDKSSPAWAAMQAYAEGVNAWIDNMRPRDIPLEYRLLGKKPIKWEPIYSLLFTMRMSLTLGLNDATLERAHAEALVGKAAADALFPVNSPIQEPIQPNGQTATRYDFAPLPPPGERNPSAIARISDRDRLLASLGLTKRPDGVDAIGSNNWAVGPSKSSTHQAILAGDPHLELTLPSVWYEMHIVVPGKIDAAGVGFSGIPGVVIGFNRNVAWTFTNASTDVDDVYQETVDNAERPGRYKLDGAWKNLEVKVEQFRDKSGSVIATDTLYFTHRGPMRKIDGKWLSRRWTALEPSHEADNFLSLGKTTSVNDWLYAMRDFVAPTQNGLVADRAGNIAIRSSGKYPVRPGDGRGDVIRDGSTSSSDWLGFLPVEKYPYAINPPQGFLASANQQPVDPKQNPSFMGSNWVSPWRAMRINKLLREAKSVSPDDMRRFQTDPGSARADAFVPLFLNAAAAVDSSSQLGKTVTTAAKLLAQWDRRYVRENRRAILFEYAMGELTRRTWDELIDPADTSKSPQFDFPELQILLELTRDSSSAWWDNRTTTVRESENNIFNASLAAAYDSLTRQKGLPDSAGWLWSNTRQANIKHLLRLDALSALKIPVQGGPSTLSPSAGQGIHGASWRMVVELGPEVRAWGVYPGGQSGAPASAHYTDRLSRWALGQLDPILFPRKESDIDRRRIKSTLTLIPAKR